MTTGQEGFLRYWARNVELVRAAGWLMLGFGYDTRETDRLNLLAQTVGGSAFMAWVTICAFIFIVDAALLVTVVVVAAAEVHLPASGPILGAIFEVLLAAILFVQLGLGLPLAMQWGAVLVDRFTTAETPPSDAGDAGLYAKIRRQFWCIGAFVALGSALVALVFSFLD